MVEVKLSRFNGDYFWFSLSGSEESEIFDMVQDGERGLRMLRDTLAAKYPPPYSAIDMRGTRQDGTKINISFPPC